MRVGNTWNNGTQPPQRWFNFNPEAHRISTHMRWCDLHVYSVNVLASNRTIVVPCSTCRGVYSRGVYNSLARQPDPTATISMDFTYTSLVMAPLADNTSTRQRWKFRFTLKFHNGHNAESTARVGGQRLSCRAMVTWRRPRSRDLWPQINHFCDNVGWLVREE